jgi:hypothetical protein
LALVLALIYGWVCRVEVDSKSADRDLPGGRQ